MLAAILRILALLKQEKKLVKMIIMVFYGTLEINYPKSEMINLN